MTILNVSNDTIHTARHDPTTQKKNASSWPEWDGSKELYPTFIIQLAAKIDTDWDLLGGNKAVLPVDRTAIGITNFSSSTSTTISKTKLLSERPTKS